MNLIQKKELLILKKIASSKKGYCLSKNYVNNRSKLRWRCENNHTWSARADHIKNRNQWCPKCAKNTKININDLKKIAKTRGGLLLSKKYVNSRLKLKWKCKNNHLFSSTANNVKNHNSWCPICKTFLKEEICRSTFEQIFLTKFKKERFSWLKSSDNTPMELDGFSKKYSLAFEYQGIQHFKLGHWIKNKKDLKKRIIDDKLKKKICKKRNILLIIISYKDDLLNLPAKIKKICKKNKRNFLKINFEKKINFNRIYNQKSIINELNEIAKKKGGKILSEKYLGTDAKLEFECMKGHRWATSAYHIKKRNSWCPYCSRSPRLSIEYIKQFAIKRGGKCLSKSYKNAYQKLKWQCQKGHIWSANYHNIQQGSWCHICNWKQTLTIKDMQSIAKKRGGKCLSKKYINANTKLKWQCSKNHIWFTTPSIIKYNNGWCEKCYRIRQRTN